MVKRRSKSLLPVIIALAAIGALVFWRQAPQPATIEVIAEASPNPESVQTGESSDEKIALEMSGKKGTETTTWSLTAGQTGSPAKRIWSAALPHDTTSGEPLSQDSETIEFAELFETKYPDYKITAVTGWGGINLIVFNTDKINGGTGPSFWFGFSRA